MIKFYVIPWLLNIQPQAIVLQCLIEIEKIIPNIQMFLTTNGYVLTLMYILN